MITETRTVKGSQGGTEYVVTFPKPENLDDMVELASGSEANVIDLAYDNFVIKAQGGLRRIINSDDFASLDERAKISALNEYAASYRYSGARAGAPRARKPREVTLTEDQFLGTPQSVLEALQAQGVVIKTVEAA